MLVVYAPGAGKRILARGEARRPWMPYAPGDVLRVDDTRVRVTELRHHIERRGDVIEHVCEVFTRSVARKRKSIAAEAKNVVRMPGGDDCIVAQFIRYHVLVRVFDGDPDAWLAHLRARGGDDGDLRFVHWIRSRLRQDPALLAAIRRMVDATPFWRVAEA